MNTREAISVIDRLLVQKKALEDGRAVLELLSSVEQRKSELEVSVSNLSKQVEKLSRQSEKTRKDHQRWLEDRKAAMDKMEKAARDRTDALQKQYEKEFEQLSKRKGELLDEIKQLEQNHAKLVATLEDEKKDLQGKISALRAELDRLRKRFGIVESAEAMSG